MKKNFSIFSVKAQTAIEYLLLLAVVVIIVLIGLKVYLPRTEFASEIYFNRVGVGIVGKGHPCGNGHCDAYETAENCCVDCPEGEGSCGSFDGHFPDGGKPPLIDPVNPAQGAGEMELPGYSVQKP